MSVTIDLSPLDVLNICQKYFSKNNQPQNEAKVMPKLPNLNFKVLQYELKPTSDAPTGFLGRHQFLCVEIQQNSGSNKDQNVEKLHFFTKTAPSDIASRMEYVEEFGVFKKEILVYREVLPKIQKSFATVAPKCYYADNNCLVFDNLMKKGFKMAAGRDGLLNYEHLNCLLKTLAAMHAGSIVYEVRQGKKINELFPEAVVENAYPLEINADHVRNQNFNNGCLALCGILKTLPKYKHNISEILQEFPRRMRTIFELAQVSQKYTNVFSHGDLWANNAMFRYGKYGEVPIECYFVDFQLARYSPPILDLITVLTIPTSRVFRELYMSELLCNYYGFMCEFLRREQLDIENYISKQAFFDSVAEFRICGLIESCLFSHLTILPPELTQQLTTTADGFSDFFNRKRVEICIQAFRTDKTYCDRMTDMLEDLVDNYVLKARK